MTAHNRNEIESHFIKAVYIYIYIGIHTSKGLAEWFSIDLTHRGQRFDSSNS